MTIAVICDRCRIAGTAGSGDFAHLGDLLEFEPVAVRPRVNGWDPDAQRAFIALLATTGELNREIGGIPSRPEINREAALQPRQAWRLGDRRALCRVLLGVESPIRIPGL